MHNIRKSVISGLLLIAGLCCANVLPSSAVKISGTDLANLAGQAISPQPEVAQRAMRALREAGPEGLRALEAAHTQPVNHLVGWQNHDDAPGLRWALALEKVGAQHDNWASRLYWYTDLEKARAEAARQGKPILSLRLLGNLDEELSCANSRFFRTALYPNAAVNRLLQSGFILHWQSVRPVPKVSIDFGDGRKIETTVTGNSIHYALDAQGNVLDALPGLYGPGAFLRWLEQTQELERNTRELSGVARAKRLQAFHTQQLARITREWQADIARSRVSPALPPALQTAGPAVAAPDEILIPAPTARNAAPVALTKRVIEAPLLQRITVAVPRDRAALERKTDDALWEKIARQHEGDARLDAAALQVLGSKTARARAVAVNFEKSIALDSVRNEYLRHAVIHQWLAHNSSFALSDLNARVYAELFLTPDSDPWLGLFPEAYTGILNDGIVKSQS